MLTNKALESLMDGAMVERTRGGMNSDPPPEKRDRVRVSSASGLCAREVAYYLTGAEKAKSEAHKGNGADVGTQMEAVILADLERALDLTWDRFCGAWTMPNGECFDHGRAVNATWANTCPSWTHQYRVETDLLRGHIDARNGKRGIIADAKTANASQFDMMVKGRAGKDDWLRQLSTYAVEDGAERIVVAVRAVGKTAKDGPQIHLVYDFAPDMEAVEQVRETARKALAGKASGILPDPGFEKGYWKCKDWCDYRNLCPSGGKA